MNKNKIKLLLLFGGNSNEHEVSLMSVSNIIQNVNKDKYELIKVGITRDGEWFLTDSNLESIENESWIKNNLNKNVTFNLSKEYRGLLTTDGIEKIEVDCAFIAMHGRYAEDGAIQGILEIADIPYIGCNVLSSAICMDKYFTKLVVQNLGIMQADYVCIREFDFIKDMDAQINNIKNHFNNRYPLFVKPTNSGSSIGVSKVKKEDELIIALKNAFNVDNKVLVEEEIKGEEIELSILGDGSPICSKVGKAISSNKEFYDYKSKYLETTDNYKILDSLDDCEEKEIQKKALSIYKALDCSGLSRVDFFRTNKGEVIFNEINTLPSFAKRSLYFKMLKDSNLEVTDVIDDLINSAIDNHNRKKGLCVVDM